MVAPHVGFIGGLGIGEILMIGVVALLVYGRKLPDVARSIGVGVAEFRRGFSGVESQVRDASFAPLTGSSPAPPDAQVMLPDEPQAGGADAAGGPAPPRPNPIPSSESHD